MTKERQDSPTCTCSEGEWCDICEDGGSQEMTEKDEFSPAVEKATRFAMTLMALMDDAGLEHKEAVPIARKLSFEGLCIVEISALQQKPAVLEGERKAALKFIDMWSEELMQMEGFDSREGVVATIKSALQSSAVEAVSFDEAFDSVHAYFRQQNSVLSFHKAQTDMVIRALVAANLLKLNGLKIITAGTGE